MQYKSSIKASFHCLCTDDPIDAKCGPDASFLGIRCSDGSACQRKCCGRGKPGGHCSGFVGLKCLCDWALILRIFSKNNILK